MYICMDCNSTNIVETEDYEAWFREGTMNRLRIITVHKNLNDGKEEYFAYCPEISRTTAYKGISILSSILGLGELLEAEYKVRLLSKKL